MTTSTGASRFITELTKINSAPTPKTLISIESEGDTFLRFHTYSNHPFSHVLVHCDKSYKSNYPHGGVTFEVKGRVHGLPAASKPTFEFIAATIATLAQVEHQGNSSVALLFPVEEDSHQQQTSNSAAGGSNQQQQIVSPDSTGQQPQFAARSGMMGMRSASHLGSGGSGRAPSRWLPEPTFDQDLSLETVKLNKKLSDDLTVLERHISPCPVEVQSIDAGLVAVTFSLPRKEFSQFYMSATQQQQKQKHGGDSAAPTTTMPPAVTPQALAAADDKTKSPDSILGQVARQFNFGASTGTEAASAGLKEFTGIIESLEFSKDEHFIFRFTIDPVQYPSPNGTLKAEFGQASHFAMTSFPGAVGQIRRILNTFVTNSRTIYALSNNTNTNDKNDKRGSISNAKNIVKLMQHGFSEEDVTVALRKSNNDVTRALQELTRESNSLFDDKGVIGGGGGGGAKNAAAAAAASSSSSSNSSQLRPSLDNVKQLPCLNTFGLFLGALTMVTTRLKTLCDYCVICDKPHVFAVSAGMCGTSVCTRATCQFRFSQLDVAKDVASATAMQTGVIDLLIVLARATAMSPRWKLIFNPYPHLIDPATGKVVVSPELTQAAGDEATHQRVVVGILKNFPTMKTLASSESSAAVAETLKRHHPLAPSMFQWIVSSTRAVVRKLPQDMLIPWFGNRHQYRVIMTSPERMERFEALKKQHGAIWLFHGSQLGNWFPIMTSGLRNVSGTALMLNGAAGGNGIYGAQNASTSWHYSQLSHNQALSPDKGDDFLDPHNPISVLAIFEMINKGYNGEPHKSSVYVMPHEDRCVVRFLIVAPNSQAAGYSTNLADPANIKFLNDLLERSSE